MKHIIFNENMLIAFFFEVCQGQLYVHVSKQQIKETKSHLIIVLGIMQGEIFKKLIRNYDMKLFRIVLFVAFVPISFKKIAKHF